MPIAWLKEREYLRCVASFINILLNNDNHYVTDIIMNRNAVYNFLKWRDKFIGFDIWYVI